NGREGGVDHSPDRGFQGALAAGTCVHFSDAKLRTRVRFDLEELGVTAVRAEAGYTARHLSVLDGLEAVRKRPGMYIGSTDSRGLMHCLWEIVDNAVDEALSGSCTRIGVELYPDGSIEVRASGRGIPVDIEPGTGLPGVALVYAGVHAGGRFGGGSCGATGGLHGVGASVVNALSSRLAVEVDRDGRVHQISFRRGVPGIFDG